MRSVSDVFLAAANAQTTAEIPIILLVIDHPTLSDPIRVCHNTENVTHDGETYYAFPFLIDLPADRDDELPRVTLTIDNTDRSIIPTLRTITTPPTVTMSVVLHGTPDVIEAGPYEFTLREMTYNAGSIQGFLSYEAILDEPFPGDEFIPPYFPGLFENV